MYDAVNSGRILEHHVKTGVMKEKYLYPLCCWAFCLMSASLQPIFLKQK